MSKSLNMRKRALEIIPNGNSLLSKRSEMFSPKNWPGYFSSAKGILVKDLDGKSYKDFSHFSVGTCILGYSNDKVNNAVKNAIDNGTMSTLNCSEEVLLAEKIVKMHPWSGMVKFARTGGEANAIAVRIARAFTKKDKILINGYHGWHDWYLSLNLNGNSELDNNLLPGLEPSGVPRNLKDSVSSFNVGDLEKVENELKTRKYAALKMEVMRSTRPSFDYLMKIRKLCDKYNTLLIFDECTSGFRESYGGLHLKYNVDPDICVLGKTIGNGFPLTCVLGKKHIMKESSSSFISSTFWTERIGFVAAIKTLEIMKEISSWDIITNLGSYYKKKLNTEFKSRNIDVTWSGMPSLIGYQINECDWSCIKTFIVDKMLQNGYLHGGLFYPSVSHSHEDIDNFAKEFGKILDEILSVGFEAIKKEYAFKSAHNTFKRLN